MTPELQGYARLLAAEPLETLPNQEMMALVKNGAVVPSATGHGWRARNPRFVMQLLSVRALRNESSDPFSPLGGAVALSESSDVLDVHPSPLGGLSPLDIALTHLELTCASATETCVAMIPKPAVHSVGFVEELFDVLLARGMSVSIVFGSQYLGSHTGQQFCQLVRRFGVSARVAKTSALPPRNIVVADDGTCGVVWDHTTEDLCWATSNPSLRDLVTEFWRMYKLAEPLPREHAETQVRRLQNLELIAHLHSGATMASMVAGLHMSRATIERRIALLREVFGTSTKAELSSVTKALRIP